MDHNPVLWLIPVARNHSQGGSKMQMQARSFAALTAAILFLSLECSSQDLLARVAKQHEPHTMTVELEFTKKNRNPMLKAFSAVAAFDPNAHASGFLVGEGLVMTSYHVVSGKLSVRKKKILGFKPNDQLEVTVSVKGCQAKVVKINPEADLALLKVCTSKQVHRPTFRATPSKDEPVLMIARSGDQKLIRRGNYTGSDQ